MMRFRHSTRGARAVLLPANCAAVALVAALVGGCSASISRFDLPGFSLTDDKKDQTSSVQTADAGNRGPNYLGNDGPRQAYSPPRSNSDSRVAVATLPDPPPSSPNYDQRGQQQYDQRNQYDQRGQQPYDQRAAYDQRNSQGYNQGAAARTPPPAPRRGESVDVQPGDTLYKLSRRHHVSVA